MKKVLITRRLIFPAVVVAALFALTAFNNLVSLKENQANLTTAESGTIEISIKSAGELFAEEYIDIKGPQMPANKIRGSYHGSNIPGFPLKILDIVPEGTIVREGDYVAQLDKTEYDNYLKGEREEIEDFKISYEVSVLDSAVTLTNLRDDIINQTLSVEEAQLNLEKSQYEPPAVMRQAEKRLDRSKQILDQRIKSYRLRQIWKARAVNYYKMNLSSQVNKVENLETYISGFTIYAPSDGMVIYKKNRNGTKRAAGTVLNNYDLVVATLPDPSSILSRTYISEIEISRIKVGQKVTIKVDALPGKVCTGTVKSIGLIGEELKGSDTKMFEVLTAIDVYDPALRPGMTTGNEILIKSYENVIYVPQECVNTDSDNKTFVYTRKRTKQLVITGESDGRNIIISSGLNDGDKIYLIPPENHKKFRLANPE